MVANVKNIAWTMNVDTALEFYKRCIERNAKTEREKVAILTELAQEGRMASVVATNKTREEYVEDKAKHFRVLKITKKDDNARSEGD